MRKPIMLITLIIFWIPSFSQVKFESISFNEALQKAKQPGKMLFLQFESATCDQCNEVAD